MNIIQNAYHQFNTERFPLPTEQQVVELEGRIGVTFPDDYRAYLLTYNGGYFCEPDIVSPMGECPVEGLRLMHGIGAAHVEAELGKARDLALFDDNKPPQVVPIGRSDMGSLVLLVAHPEERGSILFKKAFGDAFFLASGIREFFELLRENIDD